MLRAHAVRGVSVSRSFREQREGVHAMKACVLRPPAGRAVQCCKLPLCRGAQHRLCQKSTSSQAELLWCCSHRSARCAWLSWRMAQAHLPGCSAKELPVQRVGPAGNPFAKLKVLLPPALTRLCISFGTPATSVTEPVWGSRAAEAQQTAAEVTDGGVQCGWEVY